ncbi:MAG TPA: flagellar motor protein MotB [Candidatus Hydrogenedentes bacterium]|nr:flagellar motor protein MotB [Candidatus Hydrogenedentota bacterium]
MDFKKGHAEEHENDERWLITYADLITLLMVFFLVMYSMSRTDAEKFKKLASGLSQAFGKPAVSSVGVGGQPISGNSILPSRSEGDARKGSRHKTADGDVRVRRIQALKGDLDKLMEKRGLSESVSTKVDPRGPKLVMELADNLLFDAGSADLTPAAKELLKPVGEVLGARQYNIHVEGHTDNLPISSGKYRNNFDLSTSRAVNVIISLIDDVGLPPSLFSASGYGEHRPIAPNDTPEGRAKNRRVDFVIYDESSLDSMLGSSIGEAEEAPTDGATLDTPAVASTPEAPVASGTPEDAAHATPADSAGEHAPETTHSETSSHTEATHAPSLDSTVDSHAASASSHSLSSVIALPKPTAPSH